MKAFAEDEVHPVPGHENGEKAGDRTDSETVTAPPTANPAVQENDVGEKSDESPGFLGIPVPETAPGVVRPNATEDDSGGEKEDADLEATVEMVDQGIILGGQRTFLDGAKN